MDELDTLMIYEEHLNVAIQLLEKSHPNNEVTDTLEELTKEFGARIDTLQAIQEDSV